MSTRDGMLDLDEVEAELDAEILAHGTRSSFYAYRLLTELRGRNARLAAVADLWNTSVVEVKGASGEWVNVVIWDHVRRALDPTQSEGGGVQ